MAVLTASGGIKSLSWTISGLQNPFNTTHYTAAGISGSPAGWEDVYPPMPLYDAVYAPSSSGNTFVTNTISMAEGTYVIYGWALAPNGFFYPVDGVAVVEVKGDSTRPSNWTWTQAELNAFNKVSGYGVSTITWQRWNQFIDKVNEFSDYKKAPTVPSYAYMSANDRVLTAERFNAVRFTIGSMYSTGIQDVSPGDPVLGSYFITIANSLNSIT